MSIDPYTLAIPESAIDDLKRRLAHVRWPDQAPEAPWAYGTDLAYLQQTVQWWRDEFDWRATERRLNALPQYQTRINDIYVHFLHVPGKGPSPHPLLLSHGWRPPIRQACRAFI